MQTRIDPQKIIIDPKIQSRIKTSEETVENYAVAMERGDKFPPIVVFYDKELDAYILADGFHRLYAHLRVRPYDPILVDQRLGDRDDAAWHSLGANRGHGLQPGNKDKEHALRLALLHPKWTLQSNKVIGCHIGVSVPTVRKYRRSLEESGEIRPAPFRIGADGRQYSYKWIDGKKLVDAACGDCGYWKNSVCTLLHEATPPDRSSCENFILPMPSEEPEAPDDTEDEDCRIGVYERKAVRPLVAKRRSPGQGWKNVCLAEKNSDLSAVEIRDVFGENYAGALAKSLLKLLHDSATD